MALFKYSYQAGCLWGDVYESIKRIATMGYDAVEVAGVPSYFHEAKEIRKTAENEGLPISSICTMCQDCDLAFPRIEERKKGVAYMKRVVDFAAALNCKRVVINPTRLTKWIPLASLKDELKWGAESVAEIADYAKQFAVTLCVEAWNRYDTYLINTASECRTFVDMVKRDNVGVMLDTFHLNIEEIDMAGAIRDSRGYLVHLHVSDSNRAAPGMGHSDFVPLMRALKEIDYQGYVTMELVPPAADPDTWEDMNDLTEFLEEYPKKAIEYLKEVESKL
jgi:sugar phosphate isomerase/epimerase